MLVTLAVWVYVTGLTYVYGAVVLRGWHRVAAASGEDPSLPPPLVCLVGLAALGALAELLSLFAPFSAVHHAFLIAGAASALLSQRVSLPGAADLRRLHPAVVTAAVLLAAASWERTTTIPTSYDSGLYHAQAIRWIEEYGIAPGIGNLHFRFAFDSAWFPFQALFGFSFLGRGPAHVLAGWVFACGSAYLALGLGTALGEARVSSLARALLLPLSFAALGGWLSSSSPDVVVAVLLWVVLTFAHERAEQGQLWAADAGGAALVVLCIFVVTAKLSALPVLLLPLALFLKWWPGARRSALIAAACTVFLALPFLVRGVVLSGYPVFALPLFDPFEVDWKVPAEVARKEVGWILSWARVPHRSPAEVLRMTPIEWWPLWAARLVWRDRVVLALLVAGVVLALPRWWRLWRQRATAPAAEVQTVFVQGVALAGAAYWFAIAPDPRFGVGFYAPAAILLVLDLGRRVRAPMFARLVVAVSLVSLALQLGEIYVAPSGTWVDFSSRIVAPRGYPAVETRTVRGANFEVAAPRRGNQCWYEPFPCTPYPDGSVWRRGSDWKSGFRTAQAAP